MRSIACAAVSFFDRRKRFHPERILLCFCTHMQRENTPARG